MEETNSNLRLRERPDTAVWLQTGDLDEVMFCEAFLAQHPMQHVGDSFFGEEGLIHPRIVEQMIYDEIKPYLRKNLAKTVKTLLDALKHECYVEPALPDPTMIHVANGTLFVDGVFSIGKSICRNRLPVHYNPGAPPPERWLSFLDELLYPEDIPTLQEYMGYCLIPTTKGQRMLMLVGRGGEGKSRIGVVMHALLGSSMNTGSIAKVETNKFARADLENKLVMVDDDMKLEALPQTNIIKSLVTAELPMDLEKKGVQSYQGTMYARLIGFGNGTMKSLYDRSLGFFRRQIILTTKDRPSDRVDDPFLSEKLAEERDGIFLWAFEGLQRLIANDYRFTVSDRSQENLKQSIEEGNNVLMFLQSEGYISFTDGADTASAKLYELYSLWCEDNAFPALTKTGFSRLLGVLAKDYGLVKHNNIKYHNARVWGYRNIRALQ